MKARTSSAGAGEHAGDIGELAAEHVGDVDQLSADTAAGPPPRRHRRRLQRCPRPSAASPRLRRRRGSASRPRGTYWRCVRFLRVVGSVEDDAPSSSEAVHPRYRCAGSSRGDEFDGRPPVTRTRLAGTVRVRAAPTVASQHSELRGVRDRATGFHRHQESRRAADIERNIHSTDTFVLCLRLRRRTTSL